MRIARKRCTSSTAKRGQVNFARADMSTPSTTEVERSRYATIPAERATYQVRAVKLPPRAGRCSSRCRFVDDRAVVVDEPAGEARARRATQGPASPRSSAALAATSAARHVGAATVTSRQRALRRRAARGIDQMMLALAAAQPGALRDAARRETAAVERDGVATRQADDDRDRSSRGRRRPRPSRRRAARARRRRSCP